MQNRRFFSENTFVLAKGVQPHMFSFTNQKRWLQEAETHVSKIKFKGLDLFWLNTCGWSSKVGPTGKKSHYQVNHPQIGHDGTNSRILCQRAPKLQNTCFFAENTIGLAKGYNQKCSASPTKKRWLEEAEAQVSKIESKGLDLFLAEFLWMIFKGWPHRKKIASPGQPSIDRKWWDKLKNFVPTCGQITKQAFFPENTFVHAKGLHIAVGICRGLYPTFLYRRGFYILIILILKIYNIIN